MLPLPDRIWIARRTYERFDGIEKVESIVYYEDMLPMYRDYGYEITELRKVEPPAPDPCGCAGDCIMDHSSHPDEMSLCPYFAGNRLDPDRPIE